MELDLTNYRSADLIRYRREQLLKRLAKRKLPKDSKAYGHANNLIKLAAYGLVVEFLTLRGPKRMVAAAQKLGVTPPPGKALDLFSLALRVLLAGSNHDLGDANRSKYSKQLRYAYDHGIDPVWLPPFLLQAGSYEAVRQKLACGTREKWLKTQPHVPYPVGLVFPFTT